MATMQDVARHSGVSLSTVSYVLSGARSVSDETKARVQASMDKLGYSPHAVARGLASKKTRILALVFSPPERGIGLTEVDFVTKAAEEARKNSYHLVLWTVEPGDMAEFSRLIRQNLIDGIILMEVLMNDPRLDLLVQREIPFTLLGRTDSPQSYCWSDIDTESTVIQALDCLAGLGHRKICFLNQSEEIFRSGYGPAVRAHAALSRYSGNQDVQVTEFFCPSSAEQAFGFCSEFFGARKGSACIIMNDRVIPGVYKAARTLSLVIPDDVSVVAILSSHRVAEIFDPPLSTWSVPSAALASASVRNLISLVEGKSQGENQLLSCQMELMGSTGPRK